MYLAESGECILMVQLHSKGVYLEAAKYTHMDDY